MATETIVTTSTVDVNALSKANMIIGGLGSLGFAGGLFYAYKKGSSFWGYVGFGLLGSMAGSAVGTIASLTMNFTK